MIILSDYFYKCRLSKGEYKVVSNPTNPSDNRFYPARSFEVFPVWYNYILKNFPDEHIVFFDNFSDIPFEEAAKLAGIKEFEIIEHDSYSFNPNLQIHVKKFKDQYAYLHAVQRQRTEAIKFAWLNNIDYFWIDTDCLVNTDLKPLIKGFDAFSPNIHHDSVIVDAHCMFVSKDRLHQWDNLYALPDLFQHMLDHAPDENRSVRHHFFFEAGMYKLFFYGKINSNNNINHCHSSCYINFVKWLKANPLIDKTYFDLLHLMEEAKINLANKNVLFEFLDSCTFEKNT